MLNLTNPTPAPDPNDESARAAQARMVTLAQLLGEWDADAQARHDAKQSGRPLGPIIGLTKTDRALGGVLGNGLHILHGVPGVGKTALALQVAASCGCPALYVTCEMSPLELLRRVTARVTETYLGKFKTGELAPAESIAMARKASLLTPNLALIDATQAPATPVTILTMAEGVRNLDAENPHLLIVVDSLHSWAETCFQSVPEYEALNAGLRDLREIAARLKCPVLAVAERNRAAMGSGGLSAGAGSRKIEYGAESVLDLDLPDKEGRVDASGEKAVTLKIVKNRNGAGGASVGLKFHGALQRYTEA